MGLLVEKFKKDGVEHANVYAKISNLMFDNSTKVATFTVSVYPAKDDNNLIATLHQVFVKILPDLDILVQSYNRIQMYINQVLANVDLLNEQADAITNDDTKIIQIETQIANLLNDDLLQLHNAVSDEL